MRQLLSTLILISVMPLGAYADLGLNSALITTDTLEAAPSCVKTKIIGGCLVVVCDPICHPEPVPKVEQYLPDLVVTVFPTAGSDPWLEINSSLDLASAAAGAAQFAALTGNTLQGGEASTVDHQDSDIQLREVDVIGNPALALLPPGLFLLRGQATPLKPYFQSMMNASAWRSGLLEQTYPSSWIPGFEEVGTALIDDWGSTYPRTGFVLQPNIAKASAVIAVRGGSIATSRPFDYVSFDLDTDPCRDQQCTSTGEITGSSSGVEWQRVYPDTQTQCHSAITSEDGKDAGSWTSGVKDNQSFAWIAWRKYQGCASVFGSVSQVGASV